MIVNAGANWVSSSVNCAPNRARDQPRARDAVGGRTLHLCKVLPLSPGGQKLNKILSDRRFQFLLVLNFLF